MSAEDHTSGNVTQLLLDWSAGQESALASLVPLVYEELRAIASRQLRAERHGHTLQRTALVHEAFCRLIDHRQVNWRTRAQFYSLAAQTMRRILVDHARRRRSQKRGGGAQRVSLDELPLDDDTPDPALDALLSDDPHVDLGVLDEALARLERMDPRQGKLVELRFFGGLNLGDTADVLGISVATVKREWMSARAWLLRELAARGPV